MLRDLCQWNHIDIKFETLLRAFRIHSCILMHLTCFNHINSHIIAMQNQLEANKTLLTQTLVIRPPSLWRKPVNLPTWHPAATTGC